MIHAAGDSHARTRPLLDGALPLRPGSRQFAAADRRRPQKGTRRRGLDRRRPDQSPARARGHRSSGRPGSQKSRPRRGPGRPVLRSSALGPWPRACAWGSVRRSNSLRHKQIREVSPGRMRRDPRQVQRQIGSVSGRSSPGRRTRISRKKKLDAALPVCHYGPCVRRLPEAHRQNFVDPGSAVELPRSGHFFGAKSPKKRRFLLRGFCAFCAHLFSACAQVASA